MSEDIVNRLRTWLRDESRRGLETVTIARRWQYAGRLPLVSFIIPAFIATPKQAELLDETLDTVTGQTCRDCAVVVVDDGSPLGSSRFDFTSQLYFDDAPTDRVHAQAPYADG